MKKQNGSVNLFLVIIIVILAAVIFYLFYSNKKVTTSENQNQNTQVTSTNQTNQTTTNTNSLQKVTTTTVQSSGPKSIKIISPNGGEVWNQNSTYYIKWSYTGISASDDVTIGFRPSNETAEVCWYKTSVTAGLGSVPVVPHNVVCDGSNANLMNGGTYRIQIQVPKYSSGLGVADMSDGTITILNK